MTNKREVVFGLHDRSVLAAAFRHAYRETAKDHRPEHPTVVEGCEFCEAVTIAATFTTTQEQDEQFMRERAPQ